MNTVTGMEQIQTTGWRQQVKNFFVKYGRLGAPYVIPILLAAEPTTKSGFYFVTAMSAILLLFNIINLILSKTPLLKDDNKYKKILKKFFWPIVAIVGAFALFLILHLIDGFAKAGIMTFLFAKWMEGGTGASILNFFIGLLRVPLGLLYFISGGFIGRVAYNMKTFEGSITNPQKTV